MDKTHRHVTGIELRPYQAELIDQLRESYRAGHHAPLLQLATAGGKTIVFSEVARRSQVKGGRVLIVVHRQELLKQAAAKLSWAGVPHGVVARGFPASPDAPVQIGSVQTLARRFHTLPAFNLIVFDEAHHCRASQWVQLIESQPAAKLLGVTATPARLDGRGLGIHCGGPFDSLVCGPTISELIKDGWLSPARYFVPEQQADTDGLRVQAGDWLPAELAKRVDRKAITGDAVAKYRALANHQPAIAFCVTVKHAEHVAEQFRAAGYRAASVDGRMARRERDRLIAGLGNGEIEVLTSCDLISEGLDVPALGAVIMLRPTKSLGLYLQQIGRGMRPSPGKSTLIILDHVGNIRRHGRPDIEHLWSLDGIQKSEAETPVRICPACEAANPPDAEECENCGFEFPRSSGRRAPPEQIPGDLAELSPERIAAIRAMPYRLIVNSRLSKGELAAYAEHRGYKPGWVWHRLQEQGALA